MAVGASPIENAWKMFLPQIAEQYRCAHTAHRSRHAVQRQLPDVCGVSSASICCHCACRGVFRNNLLPTRTVGASAALALSSLLRRCVRGRGRRFHGGAVSQRRRHHLWCRCRRVFRLRTCLRPAARGQRAERGGRGRRRSGARCGGRGCFSRAGDTPSEVQPNEILMINRPIFFSGM
jgi:hypothetical protein